MTNNYNYSQFNFVFLFFSCHESIKYGHIYSTRMVMGHDGYMAFIMTLLVKRRSCSRARDVVYDDIIIHNDIHHVVNHCVGECVSGSGSFITVMLRRVYVWQHVYTVAHKKQPHRLFVISLSNRHQS